ncbi:MAG: carboxylating nicotinate-nucleotide diphosphorylase [Acidimicrobiales bacterium]
MNATAFPSPRRDPEPPEPAVHEAVARALAEDLDERGDLTAALVDPGLRTTMALVARGHGVLAGTACAREAFALVDGSIEVELVLADGALLAPGTVIGHVRGPMASVLTGERTALNFLCHLSGVASLTRRYVDAIRPANQQTRVIDTRKTTPGLRALEKAAVRAGGGFNHRVSLSDAVLVKDNHLGAMTVTEAVTKARSASPGVVVEIECDRVEQALEAAAAGADAVLLDNMEPDEVAAAVEELRAAPGGVRILVEVSGGVTLDRAPLYASAGADLLSVGALTHSAPACDIGLDLLGG